MTDARPTLPTTLTLYCDRGVWTCLVRQDDTVRTMRWPALRTMEEAGTAVRTALGLKRRKIDWVPRDGGTPYSALVKIPDVRTR